MDDFLSDAAGSGQLHREKGGGGSVYLVSGVFLLVAKGGSLKLLLKACGIVAL